MGIRAELSGGTAVQVNGEELQTGPALGSTPFPLSLLAIPPDLSGLSGSKSTRAFLVTPLASCVSGLPVAPSPVQEEGSLWLHWGRTTSPLAHTGAARYQCMGSAPSGIPFHSLLTVI